VAVRRATVSPRDEPGTRGDLRRCRRGWRSGRDAFSVRGGTRPPAGRALRGREHPTRSQLPATPARSASERASGRAVHAARRLRRRPTRACPQLRVSVARPPPLASAAAWAKRPRDEWKRRPNANGSARSTRCVRRSTQRVGTAATATDDRSARGMGVRGGGRSTDRAPLPRHARDRARAGVRAKQRLAVALALQRTGQLVEAFVAIDPARELERARRDPRSDQLHARPTRSSTGIQSGSGRSAPRVQRHRRAAERTRAKSKNMPWDSPRSSPTAGSPPEGSRRAASLHPR